VEYFKVLRFIDPEAFKQVAQPAMLLALRIVQASPSVFEAETTLWPHYFTLMSQASRIRSCDSSTLGLFAMAVGQNPDEGALIRFPLDFFGEYIDLLGAFIASSLPVDQVTPLSLASKESVNSHGGTSPSAMMEMINQVINIFLQLDLSLRGTLVSHQSAWQDLFIPLHGAIGQLACHPSRALRQQSLSLLQRLTLCTDFIEIGLDGFQNYFKLVFLPLLAELRQDNNSGGRGGSAFDGYSSKIIGIEETQMRAASIICKVWLHNLHLLQTSGRIELFMELWEGLLKALLELMQGPSDILRESIPESIKNMLMVMIATDTATSSHKADETEGRIRIGEPFIQVKSSNEGNNDTCGGHAESLSPFWNFTWSLLDPVIPRLRQDLTFLNQYEEERSKKSTSNVSPPLAEDISRTVRSASVSHNFSGISIDINDVAGDCLLLDKASEADVINLAIDMMRLDETRSSTIPANELNPTNSNDVNSSNNPAKKDDISPPLPVCVDDSAMRATPLRLTEMGGLASEEPVRSEEGVKEASHFFRNVPSPDSMKFAVHSDDPLPSSTVVGTGNGSNGLATTATNANALIAATATAKLNADHSFEV
jgi:hypothetical protein